MSVWLFKQAGNSKFLNTTQDLLALCDWLKCSRRRVFGFCSRLTLNTRQQHEFINFRKQQRVNIDKIYVDKFSVCGGLYCASSTLEEDIKGRPKLNNQCCDTGCESRCRSMLLFFWLTLGLGFPVSCCSQFCINVLSIVKLFREQATFRVILLIVRQGYIVCVCVQATYR